MVKVPWFVLMVVFWRGSLKKVYNMDILNNLTMKSQPKENLKTIKNKVNSLKLMKMGKLFKENSIRENFISNGLWKIPMDLLKR